MSSRKQIQGSQWLVIVLIIWLVVLLPGRAELTVSLKPEARSLFIYEPFSLLLKTSKEVEPPELPPGHGYTVMGITQTEGGFQIELLPEEAGTLTLPPMDLRAGEETARTPPLRMVVTTPRHASEMELQAELSSTNLFVDQPVRLTITWNNPLPFDRCKELLLDIPLLRSPKWDVYPLAPSVPESQRIGLPVNNQRVIAQLAEKSLKFSFVLMAREAGVEPPSDIRLNCALLQGKNTANQYPSYFDNHFFHRPDPSDHFERIWLAVTTPGLTVYAQPKAHRTARYCGITGNATVTTTIRPLEAVVGQPMLLTVDLDKLAFGPGMPALPDAVLKEMGSEFQITPRPLHESSTDTTRSFTYILRPLRSGIETVPALALDIFNPETQTYQTLRADPLRIRVDPDGTQTVFQPHASKDHKPHLPCSGIRCNRTESRLTMKTYALFEFIAAKAWILWLLPPLLWLALRPWLHRRDRCRIDLAYARALGASRQFRRTVKQDEDAAWRSYLANRFNLNAEALTFEVVAPKLEAQHVPEDLLREVKHRFARKDTEHYAPEGTSPVLAPSAGELVRKIEKVCRILLLLICLLPTFDSHAATPDQLFEQAMQIRSRRPDEALPLFTEAALDFEADRQFLNAGNSWFFAGNNGRALANYRAAESLRPFNKQVRESIAFIRAQRADVFQTPDTSAAKAAGIWTSFCRWSPVIRGGILTLIYLTGWMAFLMARIVGKRIPRRVWIVLGGLAAIPALSLFLDLFQQPEGVVLQESEARLGPGYAYDKALNAPLHEATEFIWQETHDGWVHARLPDDSDAWIQQSACQRIH